MAGRTPWPSSDQPGGIYLVQPLSVLGRTPPLHGPPHPTRARLRANSRAGSSGELLRGCATPSCLLLPPGAGVGDGPGHEVRLLGGDQSRLVHVLTFPSSSQAELRDHSSSVNPLRVKAPLTSRDRRTKSHGAVLPCLWQERKLRLRRRVCFAWGPSLVPLQLPVGPEHHTSPREEAWLLTASSSSHVCSTRAQISGRVALEAGYLEQVPPWGEGQKEETARQVQKPERMLEHEPAQGCVQRPPSKEPDGVGVGGRSLI